ncbi:MAG: leucine-rich repeat domain-containing protein, partial [Candidatus Thorarchaeota archaeon]
VLFENPKLIENAFKNRNLFYALQPFLRKIPDISKKLVKYLKDSDVGNYTFRDLLQNGCLNLLNIEDWDLILDSKKYLKSILKDQNLVVSLMKRYPQVIKKLVLRIMNNAPFKVSRMLDEIKKYERYRLSNLLKDIIEDYENKMLNPETSNFIKSKLDDLFLPNLQEADIFSLLENPQSILQKRFIRFDNRIFLIKNKVLDLRDEEIIDMRDIEHLSQHTEIKKLLLDNNHISSIRGLSKLTRLEELSLRNNKITSLRGISALVNLKVLRLEDNRITEMKGIENLTSLTELALEGNRITEIKELYKLKKLKMLNLSRNKIVKISGIEHLKQLQTLDLAFNRIIELNYSKVPYAHNIYLESNPIMRIFCQKQDIRENIVRVISFSINRFITVEFDDNIQIYVDKKLCIYLDVKGDKVYEGYNNKSKSSYYLQYLDKEKDSKIYPGFGTIELVGKLDDNQSRSKISLNKIYPFIFNEKNEEDRMIQTKFMQFCLRLQLWNECNYDPRLLQKDIAIPILRRLAILGDKDAQNVIRTEVDKKAIHTLQSIHNILDQIDFDDEDKYGIV